MVQLEFPWRDEASLQRELERRTGLRLSLTLTDNRSTVMTYRPCGADGVGRLRLHRMFLSASPRVVDALAKWMVNGRSRRADRILDTFIRGNHHVIRDGRPGPRRLCTVGRHFDLKSIFDSLNARYFNGSVTCAITWGRLPTRRRRRSIRFGCFSEERNLIRVHPLLDAEYVPEYFVRYIVFHEMLHAYLGVGRTDSGRRQIHCAHFKELERRYPDYARAVAWQENRTNLGRLLRAPCK